jgi:hypothetical protein
VDARHEAGHDESSDPVDQARIIRSET